MKKIVILLILVFMTLKAFTQEASLIIQSFDGVVYPDSVVTEYYNDELVNFSFTLNYDTPQKVFVTPGIFENCKTKTNAIDDLETLKVRLVNASLIGASIEVIGAKISQREYRLFSIYFKDDDLWYQVWVE